MSQGHGAPRPNVINVAVSLYRQKRKGPLALWIKGGTPSTAAKLCTGELTPPANIFLASLGFVDTGKMIGPNPYAIANVSEFTNQIAAMPSLHIAVSLLISSAVI